MDTSLGPREAAKVGVDRSIGRSIDRCRAGCWEGEGEGTVATRSVAMLGVVRAGAGKGRGSARRTAGRGEARDRDVRGNGVPRQRGRGGGGRGVATYHTPSIPKSRGRLAPRQIAVVGTPPLLTGKRRKEERVPLAKMAGNRLLHGPRVLFLTVVVSVCFFAVFVISIVEFSSSRPIDRPTGPRLSAGERERERERGGEKGRERGGREGRIGRREGERERENRSSGTTEGTIIGNRRTTRRTRFRVSCGSGHGGHVVADLPALPPTRLSHQGGGVSTGG